jgi:hypothetical protein
VAALGEALVVILLPLLIVVGPYLQDARPDGVTVQWETDVASSGEVVVQANGEHRFASPVGTHHVVRVSGLAPGRYKYRVIAGDAQSAEEELTTSTTSDAFTFLVYGDNRDRDYEHHQVIVQMASEHADFVLQTGDMVGDAKEDALWRRFFDIELPLLASTPMYPSLGNHELLHDPELTHYRRFFGERRYYSFRYGNSLFVSLDGNDSRDRAQAAWLVRELDGAAADPTLRHLFVFFHQPPFSVGDFCGVAAEQGLWVPELERRGVRAVFTGHDHSYQRLERNGVRYFVSGGGGAPLHHEAAAHCPDYDRHASRVFKAAYHYLRVRVRGDAATLDAVGDDGHVIETVALHEPPVPPATPAPPVAYVDAPAAAVVRTGRPPILVLIAVAGVIALAIAVVRRRRNG